jgi:hypothetical protein
MFIFKGVAMADTIEKYTEPKTQMAHYVPLKYVETPGTLPPRILDLKFIADPFYPPEAILQPYSPINIQFVFNKKHFVERTPPTNFYVQVEDIDTGLTKKFVSSVKDMPFKLWEKQDLVYNKYIASKDENIEEPENGVTNSRVFITPLNEHGAGPTSIFILPFKELIPIDKYTQNEYPITFFVNKYWDVVMHYPDDKTKQSKVIFIYFNIDKETVEKDKAKLSEKEWYYTTPKNNYQEINEYNYRWVINDQNEFLKYSHMGWSNMTEREQEFMKILMEIMTPIYQYYLSERGIEFDDPHVMKFYFEHPKDRGDSLILYFMKGSPWQI